MVPQALRAYRGNETVPLSRPFNLGTLGYVCNLVSPWLVLVIGSFVCLPPQLPATAQNMNYTPLVLVLSFLVILVAWRLNGRQFEGPNLT